MAGDSWPPVDSMVKLGASLDDSGQTRQTRIMQPDRVREVGVFDAKTRLSHLLDQVEQGDSIIITRHGRPIAQLVPYIEFDRARVRAAVDALLQFDGGSLPEGDTVRQLRDEGRA